MKGVSLLLHRLDTPRRFSFWRPKKGVIMAKLLSWVILCYLGSVVLSQQTWLLAKSWKIMPLILFSELESPETNAICHNSFKHKVCSKLWDILAIVQLGLIEPRSFPNSSAASPKSTQPLSTSPSVIVAMNNDSEAQERPAKRTKIRLACQECRDRKIRCDGFRPCNSCVRKKIPPEKCIYSEPGTETIEPNYVKSLETRIRELEERRIMGDKQQDTSIPKPDIVHTTLNPSATSSTYSSHNEVRPVGQQYSVNSERIHLNNGTSYLRETSLLGPDEPPEGHVVTAMGATEGTPPSAKNAGSVFLGPSSAAAFMNIIRQKCQTQPSLDSGGGTPDHRNKQTSRNRHINDPKLMLHLKESLVLPPRHVADEHLTNYWQYVHPLFPILHKPSFLKAYSILWTQDSVKEAKTSETVYALRAFFANLNAILALGCMYSAQMNPSHNPAATKAVIFFQRSQSLITQDSADHGSLQLVQALVLGAQYLQSSNNINKTWVALGLAIRVAQGIGIHLDDPQESQAEREERRRTWWGCVLMDRSVKSPCCQDTRS